MISLPLKNWWGKVHYALFEAQEQLNPTTHQNSVQEPIITSTQDSNRLKVNQDDLKLISTALIRYQKQLTNNNQKEKAERVAVLDEMFFELIQKNSR